VNDGISIAVEHVSKKFCKSLRKSMFYGLSDVARNMIGLRSPTEKLRKDEFWAVDDVSFEVRKGETLGIIGANGSGKTTVLSMLNGIIWPDKGEISIDGRTGALISVGAGFHPTLSGRENIYLQGGILGMTKKQLDERFDDIVQFADIGDFLEAPVKFYSSGMIVRLGFAIHICVEPEVLLIDEVLSVGDLSFQNKSMRKLTELRKRTNAVVFVSHNLEHIKTICDRVLIMERGEVVFSANSDEAIIKYHELTRQKKMASLQTGERLALSGDFSSGDIAVYDAGVLDELGNKTDKLPLGDDIRFFVEFALEEDVEELYFTVGIRDEKGTNCIYDSSRDCGLSFCNISKGKHRLIVDYKTPNLVPGIYTPSFAARNAKTGETYERSLHLASFSIEGNVYPRGIVRAESDWKLESLPNRDDASA
jgi:lipopolysaccharide transport system ATP-binding protein